MFFSTRFEWRRFFNLDLYLFLSLLYGTQVYFTAIPVICLLCFLNLLRFLRRQLLSTATWYVVLLLPECVGGFEMNQGLFDLVLFSLVHNCESIAEAIIGLFLVFFIYDHLTSRSLFVHWFMHFVLNCVRDVIFHS